MHANRLNNRVYALVGLFTLLGVSCVLANQRQDTAKLNVALLKAVKSGDVKDVTAQLDSGADPNAREVTISKPRLADRHPGNVPQPGDSALIMAVNKGDIALVKLLLDRGADPNRAAEHGFTALIRAAGGNGQTGILKLLIARGAKVDQRNEYGDTALNFASDLKQIELLLKGGANINGGSAWTPLSYAAYNYNNEAVRYLIAHGANVNFKRGRYMSPLESALAQRNTEGAEIIRKAGGKERPAAVVKQEQDAFARQLQEERARQEAETRANAIRWKKEQEVTAEDRMVIKAALLDLLAYRGSDSELSGNPGTKLVLIDKSSGGYRAFNDSEVDSVLDVEKANEITLTIRESMQNRSWEAVSLKTLSELDPLITLMNMESRWGGRSQNVPPAGAKGWVQILLPGYDSAKQNAVLTFRVGPSPHGASATYFLTKVDGRWQVKWRGFTHYV